MSGKSQLDRRIARVDAELVRDIEAIGVDDDRYQRALRVLEHGGDQKQMVRQLTKSGITRPQAIRLAQRVSDENPQVQTTNARILFGAAIICAVIGALLVLFTLYRTGGVQFLAFYNLLFVVALWFAYKGIQLNKQRPS